MTMNKWSIYYVILCAVLFGAPAVFSAAKKCNDILDNSDMMVENAAGVLQFKSLGGKNAVWNPPYVSPVAILELQLLQTKSYQKPLGLPPSHRHLIKQAIRHIKNNNILAPLFSDSMAPYLLHSLFTEGHITTNQFTTLKTLHSVITVFKPFGLEVKSRMLIDDHDNSTSSIDNIRKIIGIYSLNSSDSPVMLESEKRLFKKELGRIESSERQYIEFSITDWKGNLASLSDKQKLAAKEVFEILNLFLKEDKFDPKNPRSDSKSYVFRLPTVGLLTAYGKSYFPNKKLGVQPLYGTLTKREIIRAQHFDRRAIAVEHPDIHTNLKAHGILLDGGFFVLHDLLHYFLGTIFSTNNQDSMSHHSLLLHFEVTADLLNESSRIWTNEAIEKRTLFADRIMNEWTNYQDKISPSDSEVVHSLDYEAKIPKTKKKLFKLTKALVDRFKLKLADMDTELINGTQLSPADVVFQRSYSNSKAEVDYLMIQSKFDLFEIHYITMVMLLHFWSSDLYELYGYDGKTEFYKLTEKIEALALSISKKDGVDNSPAKFFIESLLKLSDDIKRLP